MTNKDGLASPFYYNLFRQTTRNKSEKRIFQTNFRMTGIGGEYILSLWNRIEANFDLGLCQDICGR